MISGRGKCQAFYLDCNGGIFWRSGTLVTKNSVIFPALWLQLWSWHRLVTCFAFSDGAFCGT